MVRYFKRNLCIWIITCLWIIRWLNSSSNIDYNPFDDLPDDDDAIYFIESSEHKPNIDHLGFCAIESAAIHNPDKKIHLLINRHNPFIRMSDFPSFLQNLKSFSLYSSDLAGMINFHFPEWTPEVQGRFHKRVVSISEVARAVVLFYKGGIYLDQDAVSIRPFSNVRPNFLPMVLFRRVNNAVMKFERFNPTLKLALDVMPSKLDKRDWGNFGPLTFSDVMSKYCLPNHYEPKEIPETDFNYQCKPDWNIHIPSVNDNFMIQSANRVKTLKFDSHPKENFPNLFAIHFNDVDGNVDSLKKNPVVHSIMRTNCPQTYSDLMSRSSK